MVNSRQKGKRGERFFKNLLTELFPNIRRNANEQSQMGGVDLLECDPFDFEVKCGKSAKIKKVHDWLEQAEVQGKVDNFKAVLVKPDHTDPYVIMPFTDFYQILELAKSEGVIK